MRNPSSTALSDAEALLAAAEGRIAALERELRGPDSALDAVLAPAIVAVSEGMRAALAASGKTPPPADADVLEVWQALVKGEPTWNTIRDNCRELVFYRNCLAAQRTDALPAAPARMAVRTARHVLLYIRTRAIREGWAADA
jgi:hypothetical protein